MEETVYTVSQLTREVKSVLESSFAEVWVEGEIVNYHHHTSGHRYFTLTDGVASLRCVLFSWFARHVRFAPRDGDRVRAFGAVTVYEPRGEYQLQVRALRPVGEGDMFAAFERLRQRLAAEGLFDVSRKRPLPRFPRAIGIITSPVGAAVRDVVRVLSGRWPLARVIIAPVSVQGASAPSEIADAVRRLGDSGLCEVIIVGRGGGGADDLAAFNDEGVVRAVAACAVPIVSAVGHESDVVLTDFAADVRAPTPSAAAEMVAPDSVEVVSRLDSLAVRLSRALSYGVAHSRHRLEQAASRSVFSRPYDLIAPRWQELDAVASRLPRAGERAFERFTRRVYSASVRLEALSPETVLGRGYAVVEGPRGKARRAADLRSGDDATVHFMDGRVQVGVKRVEPR